MGRPDPYKAGRDPFGGIPDTDRDEELPVINSCDDVKRWVARNPAPQQRRAIMTAAARLHCTEHIPDDWRL